MGWIIGVTGVCALAMLCYLVYVLFRGDEIE